ncbi:MAG: glycosyltransferase [Candidatus Heimdallarchaeota archaeon]|nr:glycosyltransferase [Candidatus Heimdallarchaeota archaeon]
MAVISENLDDLTIIMVGKGILFPEGGAQYASNKWMHSIYQILIRQVKQIRIVSLEFEKNLGRKNEYFPEEDVTMISSSRLKIPMIKDLSNSKKLKSELKKQLLQLPDEKIVFVSHMYNTFAPNLDIGEETYKIITFHDSFKNEYTNKSTSMPWLLSTIDYLWNYLSNKIRFKQVKKQHDYFYHALSENISIQLKNRGISASHIVTIGNGKEKCVKLIDEVNFTDYPLKIISIGAIYPRKGYHIAIRALAKIKNSLDIKFQYKIIGNRVPLFTSIYMKYLDKLIKQNNLEDDITIILDCPYTELMNELKLSQILLVPSLSEASSLTVIDGIMNNKLIIGTNSGDLRERARKHSNIIILKDFVSDLTISKFVSEYRGLREESIATWERAGEEFVSKFFKKANSRI